MAVPVYKEYPELPPNATATDEFCHAKICSGIAAYNHTVNREFKRVMQQQLDTLGKVSLPNGMTLDEFARKTLRGE